MDIKEPIGRQRDRFWPQLVTLKAKLSLLADKNEVNPNCRDVSEKLVAFCRQFRVTGWLVNTVLSGTAWCSLWNCAEAAAHMVVFPGNKTSRLMPHITP